MDTENTLISTDTNTNTDHNLTDSTNITALTTEKISNSTIINYNINDSNEIDPARRQYLQAKRFDTLDLISNPCAIEIIISSSYPPGIPPHGSRTDTYAINKIKQLYHEDNIELHLRGANISIKGYENEHYIIVQLQTAQQIDKFSNLLTSRSIRIQPNNQAVLKCKLMNIKTTIYYYDIYNVLDEYHGKIALQSNPNITILSRVTNGILYMQIPPNNIELLIEFATKLTTKGLVAHNQPGKETKTIDIYKQSHSAGRHCNKCGDISHWYGKCTSTSFRCFKCLQVGHTAKNCNARILASTCIYCTELAKNQAKFASVHSIDTRHNALYCKVFNDQYQKIKSVRNVPPSSIYDVNNTNVLSYNTYQHSQAIDLTNDNDTTIVQHQIQSQQQLISQPQQMAIQEERMVERVEKMIDQQNQLQDQRMRQYNSEMEQRMEQNNLHHQQILQSFMTQFAQEQTKSINERIAKESQMNTERMEQFADHLISTFGMATTIQLGKRRNTDQAPQLDIMHNQPGSR